MNFTLPDLQKKQQLNLLDEPTLEHAKLNGKLDRQYADVYNGFTPYELFLRDAYQIKLNNLRLKFEPYDLTQKHRSNPYSVKSVALEKEKQILEEYQKYIRAYRNALLGLDSIEANQPVLMTPKKPHTELVFCFDASFGMYHIHFFKAVNKFINLLSSLNLKGIRVAIIVYGNNTNTISEFTSNLSTLLLKTAFILPVGSVWVIFDNFKFTAFSDNDLSIALNKSVAMFRKSPNATEAIKRHIVLLTNGNLSGVVGSDCEYYQINQEQRYQEELLKSVEQKTNVENMGIKLSSISIQNDNKNIIEEISKIIFWEESVKEINLTHQKPEDSETKKKLLDLEKWKNIDRPMPKLSSYYSIQHIYTQGS